MVLWCVDVVAVGSGSSSDFSSESTCEYNIGGEWMDMWYVVIHVNIGAVWDVN